jgi:phage portal protein BeeE
LGEQGGAAHLTLFHPLEDHYGLVARTAKDLSAWLGPVFGDGLRLWFDADRIDGLSGDRDALWTRVEAASFLTEDEKREAVGYQPRG